MHVRDCWTSRQRGIYNLSTPEIRAQVNRELEQFIVHHIDKRESFAYETTLRTKITYDQAQRAKANGFAAVMRYVALNSVEESIRRVRLRSEKGGHSAPPERIREIYSASLNNLPQALRDFDRVTVYDNTELSGDPPRLFEVVEGRVVFIEADIPQWLERALQGTEFEITESLRTRAQNSSSII